MALTTPRRFLLLLVACAVLVAACGGTTPRKRATDLCHRTIRTRLESQARLAGAPRYSGEKVATPQRDRFVVTGTVESQGRSTFTCTVSRDRKTKVFRLVNLDLTPA